MKTESNKIKEIYSGNVTKHYDLPISHIFRKYKEKVFDVSSLKRGDRVLVYCCGSGLDFPEIEHRIGEEGHIVGVDFSREMLKKALQRIKKHKWNNVELIEADVTEFALDNEELFDVGICTLGLSIIPEYKAAYYSLVSKVKEGGEIIIGDMQLASGWQSRLNPLTISMAKRYGGTLEGHQNSVELFSLINESLNDVKKEEYFFKAYYFSIGKKR